MQNIQNHTSLQKPQPLVTFIVTYYNLPVPMLCECINSILALSLSPAEREIIVIDDGSEVSPMNGLMQYGNELIYVRQSNGGVSIARNIGLQMAHGKYIQIVDGDDYLIKEPYEHCLDIIRKNNDTDVVLFDFTHSKNVSQTFNAPVKYSGIEFMRTRNMRGAIWCCLFRNAVRSQLEFTPGINYGEDEEFTPQLLLRAEIVYATDIKAYFYRKREASAVHKKDEDSKQKRLNDTICVIKSLNMKADRMPNNDRLAMQRRVAQLTMDYLYDTILLTHSQQELDKRIEELYNEGLFPLPDRDYSQKYKWFRKMTNSSLGRKILLKTLPLLKKER